MYILQISLPKSTLTIAVNKVSRQDFTANLFDG